MFSRFRLLWIKSFIRFTLWKTWVSFLVFTFRFFSIIGCRIKCFNVFHFTVTALSIGFTPSLSACLEFSLGLLLSLLLAPSWFNYFSIIGCRIKCFNVFHFTVTALSIGFTPSLSACLEFSLGLLLSLLLAPSWFNYWWFVTNFSPS